MRSEPQGSGTLERVRHHWLALLRSAALSSKRDGLILGLLLTTGAVAWVLGIVGWSRYARSAPDLDLGALDIAYRSLVLFVLNDNGAVDPPVLLNLARFLAPATTATTTLTIILATTRHHLQREVARRTRDHVVLVGDLGRATPYAKTLARTTVHIDAEGSGGATSPEVIHLHGVWEDPRWVEVTGAAQAELVVIATGDDDANLCALETLLGAHQAGAPATTHIELHDRSTATWLAIALARNHPDRAIEVCCYEEGLARQAVAQVLEDLDEPGAPRDLPLIAAVGDGPLIEHLCFELIDRLRAEHHRRGGVPPTLVVAAHPAGAELVVEHAAKVAAELRVESVDSLADLLAIAGAGPLLLVSYADRTEGLRIATEAAARRPDARVYLAERGSFEALGLRSLDPTAAHANGELDGPFSRAARVLAVQQASRGWPPWRHWSTEERRIAARWLLALTTSLTSSVDDAGHRWDIDHRRGETAPPPLPLRTAAALAAVHGTLAHTPEDGIHIALSTEAAPGDPSLLMELPALLHRAADLMVHRTDASRRSDP